ncbi:heavy-metal-associated domain-containing protein [Thermosipho ferrireducens]|uniref:Heavy-metal-associated domain-containing protein n=1 Tax=Thermosipho ferrireducens TaxID=2571116 RepID=A0ABX7S6Y1_9BACT|nr:heavy-metal-associated domain-containing protein [Thermosipho ferrireducens]QTA38352.1 heavy-metal-associated domain-containing protein [Thermosipho ferrireducens]
MKKVVTIEGMTCEHCIMHVKEELMKLPGVKLLEVEVGKAIIEGEGIENSMIEKAVEEAGYEVKEIKEMEMEGHGHSGHHGEHSKHEKHKKHSGGGCCH